MHQAGSAAIGGSRGPREIMLLGMRGTQTNFPFVSGTTMAPTR
jgi:hypothetical protein